MFGLVIADTAGRPWRDGVTDFALGAAGLTVLEDLRGQVDTHGNLLEVTVRAIADEVAAAADLVKGKLDGVPAALVGGLDRYVTADDGPGVADEPCGAPESTPGRTGSATATSRRSGRPCAAGERAPDDSVPPPSVGPETVAARANRALDARPRGAPDLVTGSVNEAHG